jgi:hypothetical protein
LSAYLDLLTSDNRQTPLIEDSRFHIAAFAFQTNQDTFIVCIFLGGFLERLNAFPAMGSCEDLYNEISPQQAAVYLKDRSSGLRL